MPEENQYMAWRINYSDTAGAGDYDPQDYPTKAAATDEARGRLASNDMPWAATAQVFPIDAAGDPNGTAADIVTISRP
jgi:hypothetical protein